MKHRTSIFLWFCIVYISPSFADIPHSWTLQDCISYAVEHNIDIKREILNAEAKQMTYSEAKWGYLPTISASNSYNISMGRVLDPTTYEFIENQTVAGNNTSLSANVNLFQGLKNLHTLKFSKLDLQSSLLAIDKTRNNVILNITAYYLEILCAKENLKNTRQIVESLQTQEEKTSLSVDAHKLTMSDLLQIQSQLADAENDVLTAENQLNIAKLNLCQLLEIEDYNNFDTTVPNNADWVKENIPYSLTDVEHAAMNLPQIRISQVNIDMAKRNIRIAQSSYYPQFTLAGAYGSSYSDARTKNLQNPDGTFKQVAYPFFDQYRDNANSYISLSINIPIFGRLTARKNVNKQRIAYSQAKIDYQSACKQVSKEVNQAYIDAKTASKKYVAATKYVTAATEAIRQVEKKYELGIVNVVDFNVAMNNLIKAQTQYLQAKYEYIFKIKIIRFYVEQTVVR